MKTNSSKMDEENSLVHWVKAHSLFAYFLLTFEFTFGGWLAAMITGVTTLFDLGLWGPAISAILVIAATEGKTGIKDLLRRLLLWRVPARWYLVIIFGFPAILTLAAILHAQITNQSLSFQWSNWSLFLTYLLSSPFLLFWACEEIGWRGFALPRLLHHWDALSSSIILGILWALWHLPYYLGPGGIDPEFYTLPIYAVSVSILMTWVFNHTRGSIFVATFFHFWINIYSAFQSDKLPLADAGGETMVQNLFLAVTAILVVILYGYRNLTREQMGASPVELKTHEA